MFITPTPDESRLSSFLSRTTPDFQPALEKTEGILSSSLITAITGRKVTDQQRKLFSLPLKHGGLNIIMPKDREIDLCQSQELGKCLDENDPVEADRLQSEALTRHRKRRKDSIERTIEESRETLTDDERYVMSLASEKSLKLACCTPPPTIRL